MRVVHTTLDETQVKDRFKQALEELFQERRDLFYDLVAEVIEDLGLLRAIKEGEETPTVSRETVLRSAAD